MAHIRHTARADDPLEEGLSEAEKEISGEELVEDEETLSEDGNDDENLDSVDADPEGMIGDDDDDNTAVPYFEFSKSSISRISIKRFEEWNYFPVGVERAPREEIIPSPEENKVVVFSSFFTAGLRFPCDPMMAEILDRFNSQLHYLTPNSIVQLSKFFWSVKSFGGEVDVDSFTCFFEHHAQTRTKRLTEDGPLYSTQFGIRTFSSRRKSGRLKITKIDLSFAQRNRWDSNWLKNWFYMKASVSPERWRRS